MRAFLGYRSWSETPPAYGSNLGHAAWQAPLAARQVLRTAHHVMVSLAAVCYSFRLRPICENSILTGTALDRQPSFLPLEFLPFELTPRPCRLKIVPHLGRIISWRLATLSNGEHSSLSMMRRALKPAPHLLGPVVRMVLKVTRLPQ